ncbi:hypothetical protein V5799_000158 [Amblyomma americanum]|uniref:Uncharacterized protein n=1 Tax=Amblyomma americanum TaxID=6943 RepID=A0AAQ4D3U7_AMBAM
MERFKSHLLTTHALEISDSFDCGEAFGYGNFQRGVLLFAIVSVWVMHAHTLSFPLISGELDHWCKKPRDVNVSDDAWKSSAIPLEDDGRRSQCTVYASPDDHNDSAVVHCEQWDYDAEVAHTTIVSSWNLVCHRRWLLPLAIAVFMAGSLGFLVVGGAVADIIGRKLTILGATCVLMLAAFGGCFADTYLIYVSTRFFISGASCTLCIISGVLVAEVSTNRHRAVHVSFSGIAGLWLGDAWFAVLREVRLNWIALQFLMVAPTLLLPLGCAFIRESPRWLIARHKLKGAEAVVHEVARANGFPEDGASAFIERLRSQELEHAKASMATATGEFKSLITGTVLRRGMVVFFASFNVMGAYYVVLLTSAARKKPWMRWTSLAIDGAFNAVYLAVVDRMSRVTIAATAFTLAGVSCSLLAFVLTSSVPEELGIVLLILAKGVTGVAVVITTLCAAETFPSAVRGSGCCLYYTCARLGGMFASGASILRAAGLEDLVLGIAAAVLFLSAHVIERLPSQSTAFHHDATLSPPRTLSPAEVVKEMQGTLEPRTKAKALKKRRSINASALSSPNLRFPSSGNPMNPQLGLVRSASVHLS